jgi:predicted RNA-binding protein
VSVTAGRQAWIVVVRYDNWRVLNRLRFTLLGLPDRRGVPSSALKVGDTIFIYVASGRASIAGTIRVESAPFRQSSFIWDDLFPVRYRTSPEVTLKQREWLRIHDVVDRLSFSQGKTDWRQCFRFTLKRITPEDEALLREGMAAHVLAPGHGTENGGG